jgi:branched-chain amino acid aminotransferase
MGPITARIQQLYFQTVKGDHPKYRHWCTPVY